MPKRKVREQLVGTSGANNKIWGYKVVQTVAAASERKGLGGRAPGWPNA